MIGRKSKIRHTIVWQISDFWPVVFQGLAMQAQNAISRGAFLLDVEFKIN